MFWGTTPALDLQEVYKEHNSLPEELNILIIGGSDARHMIKTISKCYAYKPVKINFFVIELCVELVARQLLLLNIALEPPDSLGLLLKTKLFMEVYGNTLIRPNVAKYLTAKAKRFVNMITNLDYCYEVMGVVNLNEMKFKERDYLENLFKYWCTADPFIICDIWDRRVRQSLGIRYDSKLGAFDWDLHMRLQPAGAKQICTQEYKHWRNTGVAFTWLESEVSKPNRTLVAGVIPSGEKFIHHGYVGDILTGPFITYGIECKDKELLKRENNMNINRATDVTEHNLTQIFYEIIHQEECPIKRQSLIKMGTIVTDLPNSRIVDNEIQESRKIHDDSISIHPPNIKINFLSCSMLQQLHLKEKYKHLFNIIYYSNLMIDKIETDFINGIANKNCLLIIENQLYFPRNRKEQLEELGSKMTAKTAELNATKLAYDPQKDCYSMYVMK